MQRVVAVLVVALAAGCGRLGFASAGGTDGGNDVGDVVDLGDMATVDTSPPEPSLLVWLQMDHATTGSVVNSGSGTMTASCVATSCPQLVPGVRGNAYQFDGVDDVIAVSDAARTLDLPQGTVAFWGRVDAQPSTYAELVGKPYGPVASNTWEINTGVQLGVLGGGDSAGAGSYTAAFPVAVGSWKHVAATWTTTTFTLYRDGTLFDSTAFGIAYDAHDVLVGGDENSGTRGDFFPGTIDDLRIYDRVLTVAEIAALAN